MISACLDEGTLQAYLDGELAGAAATAAASHLANCDRCVAAADAAAKVDALMAAALAPALDANVPSAHLRARLEQAICELEASPAQAATTTPTRASRTVVWFARLTSLFAFNPTRAAAFASLAVAATFAVIFFGHVRLTTKAPRILPTQEIAAVPTPNDGAEVRPPTADDSVVKDTTPNVTGANRTTRSTRTVRSLTARYRPTVNPRQVTRDATNVAAISTAPTPAHAALLPGEQSYLTAIASLTSAIKPGEGGTLPPTLRAEYERNVAVVDQAIAATRAAAQRNPQDEDAQDFLRAAYQNKVELLHTVADQAQLAALRR